MDDDRVTLDQLYRAVEDHLRDNLPGVFTVATWPSIRDRVALPAVFLEVPEFEPGLDPGTGVTALQLRFEARIVVQPERSGHMQQACQLAAQLAVLLRAQTWGLAVEPAEFVQAGQDWTKPELDSYTVWQVEWTQQVYLGEEEWLWEDQPPGTLILDIEGADVAPEELQ